GRHLAGGDDDAELVGPVPGQGSEQVAGGQHQPAAGAAGFDFGDADDAHTSTSSPMSPAMAASRAVATSLSRPARNTRPQRPTARISTTAMSAAFSASLAARPAYAAGVISSTKRLWPGISSAPLRNLLSSWAW